VDNQRKLALFSLAGLALACSSPAGAEDHGWYGGINIGAARAKIADDRITHGLQAAGLTTSSISNDERQTGYKLTVGYQLTRSFALEAGYFDVGHFGFLARTQPAGALAGRMRVSGADLDGVATLPITERFAVFARLGLAYAKARDDFSGTGAVVVSARNPSKEEVNVKYGAGVQYAFTPALALRAEAERYRVNDAVSHHGDIDLYSIGLIYRFDTTPPAPPPVAAMEPAPAPMPMHQPEPEPPPPPPPVVMAPPPAPPPAPPAPTPAPRIPDRVSFSADSLFVFGKSDVTTAGMKSLDRLAAELNGASVEGIVVTGHTDRLGPHAYNQKLSTARAESVKAYLAKAAGLPADKIRAVGVDGAEPITRPGDCTGRSATPKLIACLQPDRRVDVEVTGTR
jgi:OOP family OmpA-OmpF porin